MLSFSIQKELLKDKTWVNLVNKNPAPIFYSKFRFWTANGWAICQWKILLKRKIIRSDSNLMFFLSLANDSAICSSKSEFWVKNGLTVTFYQICSSLILFFGHSKINSKIELHDFQSYYEHHCTYPNLTDFSKNS